ncbi:histidine ammonia-lyase [Bacteroidales bacterium OttesenSCG-928-K03]|nr:histidine ammonia-lyase [Bacteroidales bacterium OttesenSCG-928-K03]
MNYIISSQKLSLQEVETIINENYKISLSEESTAKIIKCRNYLDKKLSESQAPIYGINTGFGSLCNTSIDEKDLSQLQTNLVMSHACGCGEEVPQEIVKIMLLLKVKSLSFGHSGVKLDTVERLIYFFNNDILPVVYKQGSLGASGDLAPLAHLSLPLLGMGEVYYKGKKSNSADVLSELNLQPLTLASKEGLALLNGTQFMQAFGVFCLIKGSKLSRLADMIACVSLEAYDAKIDPFDPLLHVIRNHKGQIETAKNISEILFDSKIIHRHKAHVQDPYSFRCIPQVHGASKDTIEYVTRIFDEEINAVTDNPTVFPDEDKILSGGNFHGQPLALSMDFLAIALAELANISERRTYQLIAGKRGLPSFLIAKSGLNSGFMIPQYSAASIVSQNKQLCTPASVDSIESSQGQEDHVSMGANSATKLFTVANNVETVLAIELMTAAQALDFRKDTKSSTKVSEFVTEYRKYVPFVDVDRYLHPDIKKSVEFLKKI